MGWGVSTDCEGEEAEAHEDAEVAEEVEDYHREVCCLGS